MCGLVGIVGSGAAGHEILGDMRDTLCHRGPDDSGVYFDRDVALGFRRLSIIDVCTGHQPLSNETGTVWVVLNGEIYNFRELKRQLEEKGHRFSTQSDTECIVHGYEEYGDAVFSRLNGMFAISLWDRSRRRLLLARDRAGEKPLHYALSDRSLVFGSEIKALLKHPGVNREIDWMALDEFMSFGYIGAPRSIFRHIKKLLPGHFLAYEDGNACIYRYWNIDLAQKFVGNFEDARAEFVRLLNDAVRLRMISDVPLGAFLSGGLDSSAVVAFMAQNSSAPVRTFSIGFENESFNELQYARRVAELFATEHREFVVKPDAVEMVPKIVRHYGEPFADSSAIPSFYLAELTRRHVTVALNGDGGDESFAGYTRYVANMVAHSLERLPQPLRRAIAGA